MGWISGLGAITLALGAIAALAVAIAIALIHESLRQRRIRRDMHAALIEARESAEAGRRHVEALKEAVSVAGLFYLKIDQSGMVLDRNDAVGELEHAEGMVFESFDLAAIASLRQKGRRMRKCRIERTLGGRRIEWALAPVKHQQGDTIEVIGREIDAAAGGTDTAKATFLATVSHEMRTPLNGIIGMASLLNATELSAEQKSYVAAIETSGAALLALIDEILDFSRIEAGKLELISEPVAIEPLVEGVVELLAPRAQDKGVEIAAFVHPEVPGTILSDGGRLRQILMNLGANAVKFTETGGVGLRVEAREGLLSISVADTGAGIAPERLDAIFEEFEQADASVGRTHGGTGLGLAISRQLVERLGGTISVMSRLGAGSVFRVSLPMSGATPAVGPVGPDLSGERILVVSASPFAVPFLAEQLAHCGAEVTIVPDPDQALGRIAPMSTIIADAGIGMDGARRIAAAAEIAGVGRRLVMLSPYERRQVGTPVDLGYTGYLIKPVRSRSLFARFLAEKLPEQQVASSPAASGTRPLAGQRILLAEDNDINALLVRRMVERLGGVCEVAKTGSAALAALSAASPGHFLLALLDIRMPGMTGIEAVERWRRQEALDGRPRLPMAALTANAGRADREECLKAGFDGFLPKPLDLSGFENLIAGLTATPRAAA